MLLLIGSCWYFLNFFAASGDLDAWSQKSIISLGSLSKHIGIMAWKTSLQNIRLHFLKYFTIMIVSFMLRNTSEVLFNRIPMDGFEVKNRE